MIGHYLLTLTPEQEDRVLTSDMAPFMPGISINSCLVQTVLANGIDGEEAEAETGWRGMAALPVQGGEYVALSPATQYDYLCNRFGTERVNAAIRNRILANQARRILRTQEETAPVG